MNISDYILEQSNCNIGFVTRNRRTSNFCRDMLIDRLTGRVPIYAYRTEYIYLDETKLTLRLLRYDNFECDLMGKTFKTLFVHKDFPHSERFFIVQHAWPHFPGSIKDIKYFKY